MSKFNVTDKRAAAKATGPITAEATSSGMTHEGGAGYAHDKKSELFLLAVTNMVGENSFYEKAAERDDRFKILVRMVATGDPEWTQHFISWLRHTANMRSAAMVAGVEAALALHAYGQPGGRQLVAGSMARADEPGEALAYVLATYGRKIPKPIKRGIADAARSLYNQYSLLKYDTASHPVRFADVLELTHAKPHSYHAHQGDVFKYAIDRRHGREGIPESLTMVRRNALMRSEAEPADWLNTSLLRDAGFTWEDALSLVGSKVDKSKLWEALIPTMGYMALLRNLRNFDEAGVSDETAALLAARLADPMLVAKSRQFPYRFLAAFENAPSLRWGHALDKALQASLANLPTFGGRTLILIDTSGSMSSTAFSARSTMSPVKAAAVFGVALAAKGEEVDLYGFADGVFEHKVPKGASVIREVKRFVARVGTVGHGTRISDSVWKTLRGHNRVVIISDMQTFAPYYGSDVTKVVPPEIPLYGFNLGGYQHTAFDAGSRNRHELGGLTDATFKIIPLLESGEAGVWPWEM